MARKIKTNKRNRISYKKLLEVILKHKRVKLVIKNRDSIDQDIYGERLITNNGSCNVRYPHYSGYGYETNSRGKIKYSRYRVSCFHEECDIAVGVVKSKRDKVRIILEYMRHHDDQRLYIAEVWGGKDLKQRLA